MQKVCACVQLIIKEQTHARASFLLHLDGSHWKLSLLFFCICQFMIKYINNWVLLKLNESNYTLFTHQKFHLSFNRKINAVFSVKVSLNFLLLYFCVHNSSVIKTNNERAKKNDERNKVTA